MAGLGPAGHAEKHQHCTSNHPWKAGGAGRLPMERPAASLWGSSRASPPWVPAGLGPPWLWRRLGEGRVGGAELRGPGDTAHTRWACRAGPASPGGYGIGRSTCELWDGPGGDDGDLSRGCRRGIHAGSRALHVSLCSWLGCCPRPELAL